MLENTEEASVVDTHDTLETATPLMLAVAAGRSACVRLLLEYGSNTAAVDLAGRTAVFRAVVAGQEECLKLLLEGGPGANL